MFRKWMTLSLATLLLGCLTLLLSLTDVQVAETRQVATKILPLTSGGSVSTTEYEAVGTLNGGACTATLITNNHVLTAAHCVCPSNWRTAGCNTRATFTLHQVSPIDNPNTAVNESLTAQDINFAGNVRVHPEFEQRHWMREDIAIVTLDRPVTDFTRSVSPVPVEQPNNTPLAGDRLTLVGYGMTGRDCTQPPAGKLKLALAATGSNQMAIWFEYEGIGACFGDSGGPILNSAGHVVGVASWISQDASGVVVGSTYRPTSYSYNWIFDIPSPSWGSRLWVSVERAGINSHAPYTWCPNGSFLVGFDLDGDRNLSPYDAPVVGQAQCASLAGGSSWGSCTWVPVEQANINSHAPLPAWCPNGSYLVGFDLDGPRDISDRDSPVVGQVQCCTLTGKNQWGSSYWIPVGAIASHNPGDPWCFDGAFLTQFDLDQFDAEVRPDAYDAPIVGQAKCSRPR